MKRVLVILLLGLTAFAQSPQRGTYGGAAGKPPGTQGAVFAIPNAAGSQATTFEYLFDVTPAAVSITIQGCMRGTSTQPGNVGTCDAAADTYAGTTNSIRNPAFTKVYDTFLVTIGTLSAGTTLTVNTTIVVSKVGTGSGTGTGTVTSVSGTAPITSTGGATPAIGCATCTTSAGALANNAVVLGAGGQAEKTTTGFTTDGTGLLSLGSTGVGGSLQIFGSVSGSNTFSAAGNGTELDSTASVFSLPAGSTFQAVSGSVTLTAPVNVTLQSGGTGNIILTGGHLTTTANCSAIGSAANPSVAACSAAFAGSFSCATNASTGTCTVNTTAVTANSEIFITQRSDTTTGTRLGVTCNSTLTTVIPEITAVTAATSFTINLGTITTNPECFSYFIVN